jgi:formate--tetrahydrofolate ligase
MVDNHLHQGNALGLSLDKITWKRVLDVNDRALRNVTIGQGSKEDGIERSSGFDITAASEVMALLALATSMEDLRARLGRIVVGYTASDVAVTAEQIGCAGAMAVILLDAIKPNLMQTLENTPALIHTGPFGNIATGNSSVIADKIGIHMCDYLITEAGFGADMGAERFFNIKCRVSGMKPDAAVLVATVRALKAHSGLYKVVAGKPLPPEMLQENPEDVRAGAANLAKQIENVLAHGVSPVVAINAFPTDFASEHDAVVAACDEPNNFHFLYEESASLKDKISAVATKIYGAAAVEYSDLANEQLARYDANGFSNLPVCIAKTHLSISGDPTLKGAPTGHTLVVREVRASVGAGFIYPIVGNMRTMPGLGADPAALHIDIGPDGRIVGLF